MPRRRAFSSVRLRLQAATGIPKARARGIISQPIPPTPIKPSVRPKSPRALLYSFLFQTPRVRSLAFSAMRRSRARIRPNASSATATEFFPGQFATEIPRSDAASTSIVLYPAPARTTRERWPVSSMGRVTFVERTTSASAPLDRSASVRASSFASGS